MKPPVGSIVTPDFVGYKNLVGYWLMNEGGGNKVFDLSGNANHGAFVGDTHFVPGKFGSCLSFDGDDDVNCGVIIPELIDKTALSASMWIYIPSGGNANQRFFRYRRGTTTNFITFEKLNATLRIGFQNLDITSDDVQEFNWFLNRYDQWNHLAFTWDGSTLTLYANSIELGTATVEGSFDDLGDERDVELGDTLQGQIDNVTVWNCALTASEIAQLYVNPFRGIGERRGRAELIGYVAAAADIAVLRRRIEAA